MRRLISLAVITAALLAGCAGNDDAEVASDASTTTAKANDQGTFPVTVAGEKGSVTIDKRPTRIVSLSPTATEMLFAIDAGAQVAAVDDQSNYPAEAPKTKLSGFEPNVEAIVAERPDLVVLSNDPGEIVSGLTAVKVPALVLPAAKTLDDTYTQIERLGAATGHVGDAAELVAKMTKEIADLTKQVAEKGKGLSYYHELDNTFFSVTSKTFVGDVYSRLGLRNIADEADKTGSGYPQLSAEFIVKADPDLILLADTKCCKESAATVAKRPGFADLRAVKNGQVVELDDDVASRWGPRVVDFLRTVAAAVEKVEPARTGG